MANKQTSTVFIELVSVELKHETLGSFKRIVVKQEQGYWFSTFYGSIFPNAKGYDIELKAGDHLKMTVGLFLLNHFTSTTDMNHIIISTMILF